MAAPSEPESVPINPEPSFVSLRVPLWHVTLRSGYRSEGVYVEASTSQRAGWLAEKVRESDGMPFMPATAVRQCSEEETRRWLSDMVDSETLTADMRQFAQVLEGSEWDGPAMDRWPVLRTDDGRARSRWLVWGLTRLLFAMFGLFLSALLVSAWMMAGAPGGAAVGLVLLTLVAGLMVGCWQLAYLVPEPPPSAPSARIIRA